MPGTIEEMSWRMADFVSLSIRFVMDTPYKINNKIHFLSAIHKIISKFSIRDLSVAYSQFYKGIQLKIGIVLPRYLRFQYSRYFDGTYNSEGNLYLFNFKVK